MLYFHRQSELARPNRLDLKPTHCPRQNGRSHRRFSFRLESIAACCQTKDQRRSAWPHRQRLAADKYDQPDRRQLIFRPVRRQAKATCPRSPYTRSSCSAREEDAEPSLPPSPLKPFASEELPVRM